MSLEGKGIGAPTSPTHDAFQLAFETADIFSLFWQPLLKGVGRWQLELAQAGAKQSRAAIEFGQRMGRVTNPTDMVNAQVVYWQQIGQVYSEANQHITQAMARAAEPPAGIEFSPVQMKRPHETMRLDDVAAPRGYEEQRKVA